MKSQELAGRALTAYVSRRALRLTISWMSIVLLILFIVMLWGAFAYRWQWREPLLTIGVVTVLLGIFYLICSRKIQSIYRHPFNEKQRQKLEGLTADVVRSTNISGLLYITYALITLRDLLRYSDVTTMRNEIDQSPELKAHYKELFHYFGKQY